MTPTPFFCELLPLASGSQGNAVLVRGGHGALLVDAGLEREELLARLALVRQRPEDLVGLLLTHRHRDHVRSAATMSRRYRLRIFASEPTLAYLGKRMLHAATTMHSGRRVRVGGYEVLPVRLAHDAPQTMGFVVSTETTRIGIATDLGSSGGGLVQAFSRLDALYLEFNYDKTRLREGPYSWPLKQRIGSSRGHLSNAQAAELLGRIVSPRLQALYLAHVSATNNTPALAHAAAAAALELAGSPGVDVRLALQDAPSPPWRSG